MRILFLLPFLFMFNLIGLSQGIKEVKIGEQVWMGANLNVDKFQNGDPIPQAKTNSEWIKAGKDKRPAWCYYQNNAQNGVTYGKLYNWYAVHDPRGLAPKGWHIPTSSEWEELSSFIKKDFKDVNEALKTKTGWKNYETGGYETGESCGYCNGTGQYYSSIRYSYITCVICGGTGGDRSYVQKRTLSGNGTNTSGFLAKPGSNRFDDGDFNKNIGIVATWWVFSEIESEETDAEYIYIDNDSYVPNIDKYSKGFGSSVRLVKDDPEKKERERIALEEKKKNELLEIQLKEERKKQEAEQEKIRVLEAEKKEEERKLQVKIQDSVRKRQKEIRDSIEVENKNKQLANSLTSTPILYTKNIFVSSDDIQFVVKDVSPFMDKYLDKNWRIPSVKEMKDIIDPRLFVKHYEFISTRVVNLTREADYLCWDDNNKLVILNAKRRGGAASPITYDFNERMCNSDEIIILRLVKDK